MFNDRGDFEERERLQLLPEPRGEDHDARPHQRSAEFDSREHLARFPGAITDHCAKCADRIKLSGEPRVHVRDRRAQ